MIIYGLVFVVEIGVQVIHIAKELQFDFCVSVVATANRHFNLTDSQTSR